MKARDQKALAMLNSSYEYNKYSNRNDVGALKEQIAARSCGNFSQEVQAKVDRYGGGPIIQRKVITEGRHERQKQRVEVYLLGLDLYTSKGKEGEPDPATHKRVWVSKKMLLKELVNLGSRHYSLHPPAMRLWSFEVDGPDSKDESPGPEVVPQDINKENKPNGTDKLQKKPKKEKKPKKQKPEDFKDIDHVTLLENMDQTLDDAQIYHQAHILIEKKKTDGSWPRDQSAPVKKKKKPFFAFLGGSSSSAASNGDTNGTGAVSETGLPKGLVGLRNLGNTCFMNSALQCLSNTGPLSTYFLDGIYKNEINKNNPIGMKGNIAEQFGSFLRVMWSGEEAVISPKNFKQVLGRWAPQFEGFQQHDAQELLAFLLDGLHEDLNRVTKKPYVEQKEANDRPDEVVADEAWKGHLARNQSVITDLFHGQLKSTVTCPHCAKVSVTFDPFMYLSLPLLQEAERWVEITLVRLNDKAQPMKHAVKVSKGGVVQEVREAIAKIAGVPAANISMADLEDYDLKHFYKDTDNISLIATTDLVLAFELPSAEGSEVYTNVKTFHRKIARRTSTFASVNAGPFTTELFGVPYITSLVAGKTTGRSLYKSVFERSERFLKVTEDEEADSEDEDSKDKKSKANGKEEPTAGTNGDERANELLNCSGGDALPFRISIVDTSGDCCGRCGKSCNGCPIEPTSAPLVFDPKKSFALAIDWEPIVYDEYIDHDEALSVRLSKSITEARKEYKDKDKMPLNDCLKLFTTTERLGPNDPWFCPECKEQRRAWKKFDVWKLPEILVIHLKRFQFTKFHKTKLEFFVDFPVTGLDLDDHVLNPAERGTKYDLFAVSNHMGGLSGGHYTAYAKNRLQDKWFSFNDTSVVPVRDPLNVRTPTAYVLFYQKRKGPPVADVKGAEAKNGSDKPPSKKKSKKASQEPAQEAAAV